MIKNQCQVMIMLMYNVQVRYIRHLKIFKYLLEQDSVDQNGVFMTRHLPSQERKQNSYLSGLQNRKKSLLILYHAHLKIQSFVMFCILSDLINNVGLEYSCNTYSEFPAFHHHLQKNVHYSLTVSDSAVTNTFKFF